VPDSDMGVRCAAAAGEAYRVKELLAVK
jgi:hypothetical protein